MKLRNATAVATAVAAALLLPAVARAHVSVVPKAAPAGAYTVLDVRVPNERDDAPTTKVDLKLPPGFTTASFEPVPGWDTQVVREQLSTPIETENGPISEQVSRVVWSGGEIPPGAFQDFPISVQMPARAGETLTFKALQTYAGGEVVRWIGSPDAELPAAQVEVVAASAGAGDGAGAGHGDEPAAEETAAAPASSASGDDGAGTGLAVAGLVAGVAGLLLGGGALALVIARGRRGDAPTA